MKKIPTLFPKDPADLSRVIEGPPLFPLKELEFYIQIDGTSCCVIDGQPYVRYDANTIKRKRGRTISLSMEQVMEKLPVGAIACQEPDVGGHWPHWIPLVKETNPHIYEGWVNSAIKIDGTYECIGPKVQGNPHVMESHFWVPHKVYWLLVEETFFSYEEIKEFLLSFPWEGLVGYKEGMPVAKIRRKDFGHPPIGYLSIAF